MSDKDTKRKFTLTFFLILIKYRFLDVDVTFIYLFELYIIFDFII